MNRRGTIENNGNSKTKVSAISNTIIRIYYFIFMVLWGTIMYNTIPSTTSDLHMYYEKFEYFGYYFETFKELFEYYIVRSGDFIFYSIIYFMGTLDINRHLFPVIIMIFYYSTMLYIYVNSEKSADINVNQGIIIAVLAPCLVYPYILLSVLRFPMAIAFFSLGLYFTFEKKKTKIGFLFYLIALFTHTAISLGIIALCIYKYLNNFGRGIKFIMSVTIGFVYLLLRFKLDLVVEILSKMGLTGIGRKLSVTTSEAASLGMGLGQSTVFVCVFIIINLIIHSNKNDKIIEYLKVLSMVMILTTSLSLIMLLRFTWLYVFLLPYISKKIMVKKAYFILLGLNLILLLYVYRLMLVKDASLLLGV